MIISIRGTHGSGKSTVVKALIDRYVNDRLVGCLSRSRPEAYQLIIPGVLRPVYVLGPYETACGGCDSIQPYSLILGLLEKYCPIGHVVFEGALVSSSHGKVGAFMDKFKENSVMAFLDTPLEECVARIRRRREARGDTRELNTANTDGKYKSVLRHRSKVLEWGVVRAVDVSHVEAVPEIIRLLIEAGDDSLVFTVRAGE